MRIVVDRRRCEGHGVCAATAPELFRLDDAAELILTYDGTDLPAADLAAAELAVSCCPVEALRLTEDPPCSRTET